MGKIWYRNPSKSEVIDRCGADEKTRMTTQNRQSRMLKKTKKHCNLRFNKSSVANQNQCRYNNNHDLQVLTNQHVLPDVHKVTIKNNFEY